MTWKFIKVLAGDGLFSSDFIRWVFMRSSIMIIVCRYCCEIGFKNLHAKMNENRNTNLL